MSAASTIRMTPECKPARRGLGALPCPKCGEPCSVMICLAAIDEDDSLQCCECEAEFSLADVRLFLERWTAALAWLDTCPALPQE